MSTIASLSIDVDDKWAYVRSHGDAAWESRPSYLVELLPQVADFLGERSLGCTFFFVGEDLARDAVAENARRLHTLGFELANHSQSHYPWLGALPADQIEREVAATEDLLFAITGERPTGFRAPGFSWSPELLAILARRGYAYDTSVFPTIVGPMARAYCRFTGFGAKPQTQGEASPPEQRFASLADALRDLRPHRVATAAGPLVELPVTTMPLTRAPIHFTYVSFLAQRSLAAANAYWRSAMRLCRLRGVAPSLLLHPLDFLGEEDEPQLAYFPGMRLPRETKLRLLSDVLKSLADGRRVVTTAEHAKET
ncbi:MAG: polysaccharide deacetylase family protein [Lacipirellulaceae bacterium]